MKPRPITASLGTKVTERILELISSGRLVAGQRLIEPALAKELGVGTVPVREALRILAGDGVVEIVPHRGATLRAMSPKDIADTLKGIVGLMIVALDEMPAGAAPALIPDLGEIAEHIIQRTAADDGLGALNLMADYQLRIMAASGNRYIIDTVRKVHFDYYNPQVLRFLQPGQLAQIAARHREITQALAAQDIERVKHLFRQGVEDVVRLLGPPV